MSQNRSSILFFQQWTVQKAGLAPDLNEDACLIRNEEQEDASTQLMIAISDGATEAVYSRLWAKTLVEAAESEWPFLSDEELCERLKQVSKEFSPMEPGKEIPWFVRNKYMDQGSQATLLVATLTNSEDTGACEIRAVSVGDCCLIVCKASGEVLSFPMQHSDEFGVNPVLLGNRLPKPLKYDRWQGHIETGDLILVGTDAISKWALQCLERQQSELLFDALVELLNSTKAAEESPAVDLPQAIPVAKIPENSSAQLKNSEKPSEHRGFLRRLWPWGNTEQNHSTELPDQQVSFEIETEQPNELPQDLQAATDEVIADLPPKFEQFIQRYRAPESPLHMRNDDSTLVICVPVRNPGAVQDQEVLQVISSLKLAVAQRLQASQQMVENSST